MRFWNSTADRWAPRISGGRTGATLAEVLIAILVMSIGVLSVAALFPVSIIRSAQANQLTVATGLRYNVEQILTVYSQLVTDPDGNQVFNEQQAVPFQKFVIDPLGYSYFTQQGNTSQAQWFGYRTGNYFQANTPSGTNSPAGYNGYLRRYGGQFASGNLSYLDSLAACPDSWTMRFEDIATASTSTSVTLPQLATAGIASPTLPYGTTNPYTRIVLFDTTGTLSQIRPLVSITGTVASWDEDAAPNGNGNGVLNAGEDVDGNGILAAAVPFTVGKVRIETQERRFSWIITARQDAARVTDVDVVVFFKRSFEGAGTIGTPGDGEEFVFLNNNGNSQVFSTGNATATLSYTGTDPVPFLKKGGFIFDPTNCYWYQIENYTDSSGTVTLKLDRDASAASNTAMLFRGVVDVYSIGQVP
jgi:hypothetical protein